MEPPFEFEPETNPPFLEKKILLTLSGFLIGLIVIVTIALILRSLLLARSSADAGLSSVSALSAKDCRPSTLVLGTSTFLIRDLTRLADGSLAVPPDTYGIAYRLQGTESSPVFVLSPSPENLAVVPTIDLGSLATATWSDCTFTNYRVYAHQMGSFHTWSLQEQSQNGITVFFPIDPSGSGAGFVFTARVSNEPVSPSYASAPLVGNTYSPLAANTVVPSIENAMPPSMTETMLPAVESTRVENTSLPAGEDSPTPAIENTLHASEESASPTSEAAIPTLDPGKISAEINFSDDPLTNLGTSIKIEIQINNYGNSAFTLSASDVSLTQSDGTPLALQSSQPNLPEEIQPGERRTFQLVFPHPTSPSATLKIFSTEFDIEGY